jgi:hypothetical protein
MVATPPVGLCILQLSWDASRTHRGFRDVDTVRIDLSASIASGGRLGGFAGRCETSSYWGGVHPLAINQSGRS